MSFFRTHLLPFIRPWKLVTFRKLLYLPKILAPEEKRLLLFLLLITLLAGAGLSLRLYLRFTQPIPTVGGSYTEGILGEPRSLHPFYASRDAERDIVRLIYSGLFTYDSDGILKTDLAESYEISPDGKTYAIRLKKNARWHDKTRVSADDVVFTVQAIQNPDYKSYFRANWQGVKVEKVSDDEVRFTLRAPYAPFIENLTLGIIPRHVWAAIGPEQILLHELNLKPIGSGPYQFSDLTHNKDGSLSSYMLVRNPRYHREGPLLKKITLVFFKTEEELIAAWHRGTIEGFGPLAQSWVSALNPAAVLLSPLRMPRVFGIFFNEKKSSFLADKKIRTAIAHAIDKERIAQGPSSGGAIVTDSPLPWIRESAPGAKESAYPYDPLRAQKILEEAGWRDENGDGIREQRPGKKGAHNTKELRLTLTTSDWPYLVATAAEIKQMLHEVAIEVTVETKPFAELEAAVIRPRNFEILLFGQVYGYEPDPFAFWHSSQSKDPGLNITFYHNKTADGLLEETRRIQNLEERNGKYEEFSKLVIQDLPAVFLFSQLYLYLLPGDMRGVELGKIALPSDRFNHVNQWYRKTERVLRY